MRIFRFWKYFFLILKHGNGFYNSLMGGLRLSQKDMDELHKVKISKIKYEIKGGNKMKVKCNCGSEFSPEIIIHGGESVTIFDISSEYQDGNFDCPFCDQSYYIQIEKEISRQ